ncbi:hypothetical protein PG593_03775 [Riemerella anatipestifer]|nr:hypothetical protein [Riemerella anatipestifer]MDY3538271.1 hypothetical protein [Riemerella anatipestifer]
MKKRLFLIFGFVFTFFSAQKKDNCKDIMNRWDSWDIFKKPSVESVKKCLSKKEKKIKIEVFNNGDYNDLVQVIYVEFTKVNNGNYSPILKNSENLPHIVIDKNGKEEWKNSSNKDALMISQSYTSEDNTNIPLKEMEIYETTAPISSGVLRISGTYRKDFNHNTPTNLTKTINIYTNDKLLISKDFSFEELEKTGGIVLEFNAVEE